MKYVYVITHGILTVGVARKRKGIRRIIERDWLPAEERPLIWSKGNWAPFVRVRSGLGLASHPGLEQPYRVEKFGVL